MSNPSSNYRQTGEVALVKETTTGQHERLETINGALITAPVSTPPSPTVAENSLTIAIDDTVGGTPVLSASSREGVLISNNGSANLWLGLNATVVVGDVADANGGVLLVPGGAYSSSNYSGPIRAIADTGTSSILGVQSW